MVLTRVNHPQQHQHLYPQHTGPSSERGRPRHVSFYLTVCIFGGAQITCLLRRQACHCWALLLRSYKGDIIRRWRLTDITIFQVLCVFTWMECQTLSKTHTYTYSVHKGVRLVSALAQSMNTVGVFMDYTLFAL